MTAAERPPVGAGGLFVRVTGSAEVLVVTLLLGRTSWRGWGYSSPASCSFTSKTNSPPVPVRVPSMSLSTL